MINRSQHLLDCYFCFAAWGGTPKHETYSCVAMFQRAPTRCIYFSTHHHPPNGIEAAGDPRSETSQWWYPKGREMHQVHHVRRQLWGAPSSLLVRVANGGHDGSSCSATSSSSGYQSFLPRCGASIRCNSRGAWCLEPLCMGMVQLHVYCCHWQQVKDDDNDALFLFWSRARCWLKQRRGNEDFAWASICRKLAFEKINKFFYSEWAASFPSAIISSDMWELEQKHSQHLNPNIKKKKKFCIFIAFLV